MVTKIPSLLLQISLYFNGLYLLLFYLVEIVLLFVKSLSFPYPARNLWPELILLIFLSILDATRIFLGMKGNLTGRKLPLVISIAFLFPLLVGYLYYVLWQTYVLTVELATIAISYIGLTSHFLMSIAVLWILLRNQT